jgi:hypothetical protein
MCFTDGQSISLAYPHLTYYHWSILKVVWDIVRAWCKDHPPNKRKESKRHKKGEAPGSNAPPNQRNLDIGTKILSNEMKTEVDFTIPKGFGAKRKARRYAVNPEANWGPKKAGQCTLVSFTVALLFSCASVLSNNFFFTVPFLYLTASGKNKRKLDDDHEADG